LFDAGGGAAAGDVQLSAVLASAPAATCFHREAALGVRLPCDNSTAPSRVRDMHAHEWESSSRVCFFLQVQCKRSMWRHAGGIEREDSLATSSNDCR
jgi:hypothetical protein